MLRAFFSKICLISLLAVGAACGDEERLRVQEAQLQSPISQGATVAGSFLLVEPERCKQDPLACNLEVKVSLFRESVFYEVVAELGQIEGNLVPFTYQAPPVGGELEADSQRPYDARLWLSVEDELFTSPVVVGGVTVQ